MTAEPVLTGEWYQRLPEQYRDRVTFDPRTGLPKHIDVVAGPYQVPGELTNADRQRCGLPPLSVRPGRRRPWDPPA